MGISFGFGPSAHARDAVIRLRMPVKTNKVLKYSHLHVYSHYLITVVSDFDA